MSLENNLDNEFFRRVSIVAFYNDKKDILLQDRRNLTKRTAEWGFFGGGIEKGETPEAALVREIKEELCYDLKDFSYFKKRVVVYDGKSYEINIFLSKINDVSKFKQMEGQGMNFFSFREAKELDLFTHDYSLIDDLKEYFEQSAVF